MNHRLYLLIGFSLGLLTLSSEAISRNACATIHIQIANMTESKCTLAKSDLLHGYLDSSPPLTILANDSKNFDITQTVFGPDVTLEYNCGDESIIIESQQNYCYMLSGSVKGKIISKTPNIRAFYTADEGSYFWQQPGTINWTLIS